ncbi:MAG TPA: fibronectin type III domain-containing protein, partial [Thermoanaerobaculia bacterium]|nr:fibronectin type III domain-containing protein [Thermoanaerobaculia bacterium]
MSAPTFRSTLSKLCLAAAGLVLAHQAGAQVMLTTESDLHAIASVDARLDHDHATATLDESRDAIRPETDLGFDEFVQRVGGTWVAQVDRRNGHLAYVEGSGIPWFPGAGNSLRPEDVTEITGGGDPDLAAHDRMARRVAPELAPLFGFDPDSLSLNLGRSGAPAPHVWFVDYDVLAAGQPIEGARVLFVVNNGNLISVGTENLPARGSLAPEARLSVKEALAILADHVGGIRFDDQWVDAGSYHLLPIQLADASFDEGFATGSGRGIAGVWQFVFRRPGQIGTFRGRIDAVSGEVLEFRDVNDYGSVTGGVYQNDRPAAERVLPMPFADYATSTYSNSAGIFSGTSGTTALNGQYVRISDSCGSISKSADGTGAIALGSSSGTDCTTPGTGGSGNTHSARTQFYNLNRIKEVGRGWLPSNTWLSAKLTANVNLNQTCNAYWNGSTVNFFRSGGGCANTGELPGVSLHEYGHGLDSNDGSGSSADNGTGETYGDFTAALATHASCVGNGFFSSGSNCSGYGDSCTSCSGIRDIDYAKHASNTPHTVDNFTRVRCPTSSNYRGPCGREGHCESYVSSEALWDLANRDLPSPGTGAAWTVADRLWYLSRSTATKAFNCTTSSTPWTANGCFTGSYFRSMRAVDDDDGNLSNGTPHGGALATAFNRHGIACTTDTGWNVTFAGVTPPATPSLTATGGNNSVALSWSGSSGVYDVYRNETGCNAGFTRVANDVSGASYNDGAVANGLTYYYQVVAQPSGNEAAASAPSVCRSVTPSGGGCTPPAAPTGVSASATSQTAITVSWSASSGATSYKIYRSTTSGGPYSQVGTSTTTSFANSGLTCNTTYYYVVTASNGTCDSGNSSQASATTQACSGGTTATWDATLQAPKCGAVVNSCDTGASLVLGRAGLGPEPNQPNTINDSCADGTSGSFHSDESNDRVKVYTLDGTSFAPGKQVRVEATVWAWSGYSSDHLDLYYAADATSPSWTYIGTVNPTAAGQQVLSATYTL